jgi:hypothetical protein
MNQASRESNPRIDTVPPPPGASDLYSATTRVATLPEEVLEAMRQARAEDRDVSDEAETPAAPRKPRAASPRRSPAPPALPRVPSSVPPRLEPPAQPLRVATPLPAFVAPIVPPIPPLRPPSFHDAYAPSFELAPLPELAAMPELAPARSHLRGEVLRSIGIVVIFGLLGGVVASVIMLIVP